MDPVHCFIDKMPVYVVQSVINVGNTSHPMHRPFPSGGLQTSTPWASTIDGPIFLVLANHLLRQSGLRVAETPST